MPLRIKRMREEIAARKSAAVMTQSADPVVAQLEADFKKDLADMKLMPSLQHRAYAKRERFAKYWHYVSGIVARDEAINDNLTRWMLVWAADAKLFDEFLAIATYMLRFNIQLPSDFKKTPLTSFFVDAGYDMLLAENEMLKPISATDGEKLNALIETIDDPRLQPHDQAYAKFLKELGSRVEELGTLIALKRAVTYYEKALMLNEKVGVKQDIARVNKEIEKLEKERAEKKELKETEDSDSDSDQESKETEEQFYGTRRLGACAIKFERSLKT